MEKVLRSSGVGLWLNTMPPGALRWSDITGQAESAGLGFGWLDIEQRLAHRAARPGG